MSKFLAPGVVVGALACAAAIANVSGYPLLGAFLGDPSTAVAATNVATGLAAIVAGVLNGIKPAA
jgi:hypothetical protein